MVRISISERECHIMKFRRGFMYWHSQQLSAGLTDTTYRILSLSSHIKDQSGCHIMKYEVPQGLHELTLSGTSTQGKPFIHQSLHRDHRRSGCSCPRYLHASLCCVLCVLRRAAQLPPPPPHGAGALPRRAGALPRRAVGLSRWGRGWWRARAGLLNLGLCTSPYNHKTDIHLVT